MVSCSHFACLIIFLLNVKPKGFSCSFDLTDYLIGRTLRCESRFSLEALLNETDNEEYANTHESSKFSILCVETCCSSMHKVHKNYTMPTCSASNKLSNFSPLDMEISSKAFMAVGCSSFLSVTWCSC